MQNRVVFLITFLYYFVTSSVQISIFKHSSVIHLKQDRQKKKKKALLLIHTS